MTTLKARELLKLATKLRKENKIEKAIKILEQAYSVGEFGAESGSGYYFDVESNNYYTTDDLVRKSKYLQLVGIIEESLSFLNQIILETNKRAKNSIWEIYSLSSLHNHRSIILKKEKRYNEAFIDKIKYYCLDGVASVLQMGIEKKDKHISEKMKKALILSVRQKTNNKFIFEFIENNSKKVNLKYDKKQLAGFIWRTILADPENIIIGIDNLLQSND